MLLSDCELFRAWLLDGRTGAESFAGGAWSFVMLGAVVRMWDWSVLYVLRMGCESLCFMRPNRPDEDDGVIGISIFDFLDESAAFSFGLGGGVVSDADLLWSIDKNMLLV